MKSIGKIFFLLTFFFLASSPLHLHAVSPSPIPAEREEQIAKSVNRKGDRVCLFQSGTEDVKKEIRANDILTVYRENKNHQLTAIGKIKILSYVGEDYLKGEVIEGELMSGDIAKKGDAASLVVSSSDTCK